MKVLFAAAECAPLAKVGGLGDVIGSLPKYLCQIGIDTAVVLPAYKPVIDANPHLVGNRLLNTQVRFANKTHEVNVYKTTIPESYVPLYLIYNETFISNGGIYLNPTAFASSQDEIDRFAFFSKAVAHVFLENPTCDFLPDIIHCHDWHTALIPRLIKKSVPTVFTIHNLANQGFSAVEVADKLGLDVSQSPLLSWDAEDSNLDLILHGITSADVVTTVSPRYAKEIQTPLFGEGLHEVIEARQGRVYGILNGVDYDVWNPETDPHIAANYSFNKLLGKQECKKKLQRELNLQETLDKPILALIARITAQKGVDLVIQSLDELLKIGCQVVILGSGDPSLENQLRIKVRELEKEGLFEARVVLEYNDILSHKIYSGADFFLAPSRFEPCGLTQIIAMRYGTVPIVRNVGGLADTVESGVTGFTFDDFRDTEFTNAVKRGLNYWKDHESWERLQKTCMQKDFSWKTSAKEYEKMYNYCLSKS